MQSNVVPTSAMKADNPEVKLITASVLEVLDMEQRLEVASIGESRLQYFLRLVPVTGEKEFRDAIHDYKESHKDAEGKPDKSAQNRAGEFSALYFASLNHAAFPDMGYQSAVSHARQHLDKLGLRINGKPILNEEQKEANRIMNERRKASNAATKRVDFGKDDYAQALEQEIQKELAAMQAERETKALDAKVAKIDTLVKSIMADGEPYAMEVFTALATALGYEMNTTVVEDSDEGEVLRKAA